MNEFLIFFNRKIIFLFLGVLCFYTCTFSQTEHIQTDIQLLQKHTIPNQFKERQVKFGLSNQASFIKKYNPVSLSLSSLMFFYQKFISPQFFSSCLYSPSCSEFSIRLIKQYGIFTGTICSADRLMRCNGFARNDIEKQSRHLHYNQNRKIIETTQYYKIQK